MSIWHKIKRQDLIITFSAIYLGMLGLLSIFSATFYSDTATQESFGKQALYLFIGILIYLAVISISGGWLQQKQVIVAVYSLTIVTLLILLLSGEVIAGTRRWIDLGIMSIQPSEFAKLVAILTTAYIFSSDATAESLNKWISSYPWAKRIKRQLLHLNVSPRLLTLFAFSTISTVPLVVLIIQQPSLGNSIILLAIWAMIIVSLIPNAWQLAFLGLLFGVSSSVSLGIIDFTVVFGNHNYQWGILSFFLILGVVIFACRKLWKLNLLVMLIVLFSGLLTGVASDFAWNQVLDDYQKDRIVSFVNPEMDPQGSGWQVERSKLAIASSYIPFGYGFLQGPQVVNGYLPFPQTDFIYASFVEQFSDLGALLLLAGYAVLLWRILQITDQIRSLFGKIVSIGVAAMLLLNILINIGMNLGLMPVTGVPLPLVSYGGSSVLVTLIGLGLVQMYYTDEQLLPKTSRITRARRTEYRRRMTDH